MGDISDKDVSVYVLRKYKSLPIVKEKQCFRHPTKNLKIIIRMYLM